MGGSLCIHPFKRPPNLLCSNHTHPRLLYGHALQVARLEENVGGLDVTLSAEDKAALEAAVPHTEVVGDRYENMAAMTYHYGKA